MGNAMDSYPELNTRRLRLRKPVANDIPQIVKYANNPRIEEMTLSLPYPYQEKDAISWINMAYTGFEDNTGYKFAIELLPDKGFIGCIGLEVENKFNRAELGYWIAEPYWNHGYASEAVQSILEFGFEKVDLHKIFASHYLKNPASGRVMTKNGMIREAELKDHVRKGDEYISIIQYRLTREEFHNRT